MTLDEAITHAREIAERGGECAEDHKQLAEWLDELRKLRTEAATLGRPKAKSYPYGYEPDTGAFDATRCECGCINDISATYCNDCGGEIEIDMNAEKEIYHTPAHMVFAEKHDDGSLEFAGKRYIAATLGDDRLAFLERKVNLQGDYIDKLTKEKNALFTQNCEAATRHAGQMDTMQRKLETATLGRGTCKLELATDMESIRCSACGYKLPKGTDLKATQFCGGCGCEVEQ